MNRRLIARLLKSPWSAVAAATALHIGAVMALGHYRKPILWENGSIASYMLAGKGFSVDFAGPAAPTSWQAPGYPFVLWLLIGSFGDAPQNAPKLDALDASALGQPPRRMPRCIDPPSHGVITFRLPACSAMSFRARRA